MVAAIQERMPLLMRFAIEPLLPVSETLEALGNIPYDPSTQTSVPFPSMSPSYCSTYGTTGNALAGYDEDLWHDDDR